MSTLEVIGAGLGRTGTFSLKLALEELGFDPCHHMHEAFSVRADLHHLWRDVYEENNTDSALEQLFEGYKAAVDYPGCMFYEKFLEWNPDAKVILSVRDSAEKWAVSCRSTIFSENKPRPWYMRVGGELFLKITLPSMLQYIHKLVHTTHGVDPHDPETDLAQMYRDWVARVEQTVPPEKLLIFNVKEGWEPLCSFLGVPVPEKEFPRTNTTEDFQKNLNGMLMGQLKKIAVKSTIVGILVAAAGIALRFYYNN